MRILVVDNYDSFTFNLTQLVEECGAECDVVKNDRLDFNVARRYQEILISPGPGVPSEAGGVNSRTLGECDSVTARDR